MRWLLWKDYRHNRAVVIAGLFLLSFPYLIVLCTFFTKEPVWVSWDERLIAAGVYGLIISQLTVALLGGNAIAGERVDRSAEFLASLPITRRKILASKLLLCLIVVAAIWLISLLPLYPACWARWARWTPEELPGIALRDLGVLANIALTGLVCFGVAWWLSALLASPTFSVFGGLAAPALFMLTTVFVGYLFNASSTVESHIELWYRLFCLSFGPVCFVAGTWYYLRRVEP
jgi:ABC-type Na+ efflux pump permease subunit